MKKLPNKHAILDTKDRYTYLEKILDIKTFYHQLLYKDEVSMPKIIAFFNFKDRHRHEQLVSNALYI